MKDNRSTPANSHRPDPHADLLATAEELMQQNGFTPGFSPEAVQQLAAHAQSSNPSVVQSVSSFYAQHTTLIKTLGGTALTIALAKVAEKQRQA